MAIYNLSFLDNVTSPLDMIIGLGSVADNQFLFGYLTLLSFFLVFMILSLRYDFTDVMVVDSFLTTLLAILLYASKNADGMSLIPGYAIVYPLIILFISLILKMINK